MSLKLDDPPYKAQFLDANGYLSQPWMIWIRTLFLRVGQNIALSNVELQTLSGGTVAEAQIAALAAVVTSNKAAADSSFNDFAQGRYL